MYDTVLSGDIQTTLHTLTPGDARHLSAIDDGSIAAVVTSPPYPMVAMWDDCFSAMDGAVQVALDEHRGDDAWELMHHQLEPAWKELRRVLCPGGIACINVGDATRTVGKSFKLYANASRIQQYCQRIGFHCLPSIIWRKPTNSPTKFMGSGMLPAGAYVTLEHEMILVVRNGEKRRFDRDAERRLRRQSAFFWEERNDWFSDVWLGLTGISQDLPDGSVRSRSGAFPLELAYRLISMFSVQGDTILDPFVGIGTTTLAAAAAARHSIGVERESAIAEMAIERLLNSPSVLNRLVAQRLENHRRFMHERAESGHALAHANDTHGVACMSRQETELVIRTIESIERDGHGHCRVVYDVPTRC